MIDLHSHTTASDGTLQPCELIQQAADKKISVIAVTDHDTTAGLREASAEAKKLGFETCILPEVSKEMAKEIQGIKIVGVKNIGDAVALLN